MWNILKYSVKDVGHLNVIPVEKYWNMEWNIGVDWISCISKKTETLCGSLGATKINAFRKLIEALMEHVGQLHFSGDYFYYIPGVHFAADDAPGTHTNTNTNTNTNINATCAFQQILKYYVDNWKLSHQETLQYLVAFYTFLSVGLESIMSKNSAALGRCELLQAALGCSGLILAALSWSGLLWTDLACSELLSADLGCSGLKNIEFPRVLSTFWKTTHISLYVCTFLPSGLLWAPNSINF